MKGRWESNINVWFPFYVFSEMKLCAAPLFIKQNYNVLSSNSYTDISVGDLYISRIGLAILLQPNMWIPGKYKSFHRHMNVEIGTEAAQCPEKECINGIFIAVLVCPSWQERGGSKQIRRQQKTAGLFIYKFPPPAPYSDDSALLTQISPIFFASFSHNAEYVVQGTHGQSFSRISSWYNWSSQ